MQIVSGFFYGRNFLVISIDKMTESKFKIRKARLEDFSEIKSLYQSVAKTTGGIARIEEEITDAYIKRNLEKSLTKGVSFVVEEIKTNTLVGEIHCYKL